MKPIIYNQNGQVKSANERIIAFDLLRALMLFLLFVFHSGVSFMDTPVHPELWPYKDSVTSILFDGVLGFIHTFRHPAFFLISGFVTQQMFLRYSLKEVLIKRFMRLFLPMLFVVACISPLVNILIGKLQGLPYAYPIDPSNSFFQNFLLNINSSYVWFLYYLLIFSLIHLFLEAIGLGKALKSIPYTRKSLFVLLGLLSTLVMLNLTLWQENSLFGQYDLLPAIGSLGGYFVFYLFGAFMGTKPNGLEELKPLALPFILLGTFALLLFFVFGWMVLHEGNSPMLFDWRIMIASSMAAIFYVFGILGFALKFYIKPNQIVRYIARSSYFLYLIHFPILLLILNEVVLQEWNVFVKFLVVLTSTCMLSLVINMAWLKIWQNKPPI